MMARLRAVADVLYGLAALLAIAVCSAAFVLAMMVPA